MMNSQPFMTMSGNRTLLQFGVRSPMNCVFNGQLIHSIRKKANSFHNTVAAVTILLGLFLGLSLCYSLLLIQSGDSHIKAHI